MVKMFFRMNTKEVVQTLGISEPTVLRWLTRGIIQGTRRAGRGGVEPASEIPEEAVAGFLTRFPIFRVPPADRLTLNETCAVLGLPRNQRGHDRLSELGLPVQHGPERRGFVSRQAVEQFVSGSELETVVMERLRVLRQIPAPNVDIKYKQSGQGRQLFVKPHMVLRVQNNETAKLLTHVICRRVEISPLGILDPNGKQLIASEGVKRLEK